jgi:hypothetical protein
MLITTGTGMLSLVAGLFLHALIAASALASAFLLSEDWINCGSCTTPSVPMVTLKMAGRFPASNAGS